MTSQLQFWLGCTALTLALALPARAASTLEREFRYDPARVAVERGADEVRVRIPGGMPELRPGRPDLPWTSERLDLPVGVRVRGVEILELESAPLAASVRIPSTIEVAPGLGAFGRTAPDPEIYGRTGFFPDPPAELGLQGFQRGENVAWLKVSPVRWDPASGRLEAITRLRVAITLEPSEERPLARERIVREWERGAPGGRPGAEPAGTTSLYGSGAKLPQPFRPTQVPSVMGSPVEYLILTNETMLPEFERLATWKTQSGVPAAVRTMSFIRQEYPGGADDAERMRTFIRDAYTRWGTKWVLLAGDTDVLPTRFPYTRFYNGNYMACDLYFSCLDGNWNADGDSLYGEGFFSSSEPGDSADLMPDVYVGRAPCVTLAQAKLFVDKTLMYSMTPVEDYMTRVLFFAEVLFPQNWSPGMVTTLDGAELAEEVLPFLQADPNMHYARLYENHLDPRWEPGALIETRGTVIDSMNRGYNIAVHIGHGYRNVMSVGTGSLENADAFALSNGNRLINLYAINCTSNAIDFPSIGEAFILCPTGGAVTNIGSTHYDFPTAGRAYENEYFRLVFEDSVNAVGEAQARAKIPFIGFSTYDGVNRWTQMTLLLLGDPELRIFTGTPRTLAVSHAPSMSASDSTFTVNVQTGGNPLYGARVVAYRAGMEYRIGTTDGAGNATLAVRPDSARSFTLTVVGYDCKPYQATIAVTPSALPVLAADPPVIDDDMVDGTIGDADGILDAGETVDLLIALRNNGGSSAPGLTGTLSTTDSQIQITQPGASYGSLSASASAMPASGFRVVVPAAVEDQREVPFDLVLVDANGRSYRMRFQLVVRAPEMRHFSHLIVDQGGNSDGRPDPGETVIYYVKLRNLGTGGTQGVTGKLRNSDGLASVLDSSATWGDFAPGQEKQADVLVFVPSSTAAVLELEISNGNGVLLTKTLDLSTPSAPAGLFGIGRATSIELAWARNSAPDLLGYNIYRASAQAGPFTKINPVPTDRISAYTDAGLSTLTRYYYRATAVDSSGNESNNSAVSSASTNPPLHAIFPIPMGRETPSSVAIDHIYSGYPVNIVSGSEVLYMLHPDGQTPVDADGAGSTHGDFTRRGFYYAAGPSIADLDGGEPEIIGLSWGTQPDPSLTGDSMMVFVFAKDGTVKPGWPQALMNSVWGSAAAGDFDGDGLREIAFGSNGNKFYAFRADGTELMDGDSNPATIGVFKVLGNIFNYGTPAVADLDGDGKRDIIFGSFDGKLYAWRWNGTDLPGFPVTLTGSITASVAVGYLDGSSDTQLDIAVISSDDKLWAIRADGTVRPGFPKFLKSSGTSKSPSPALADMNNDTFLDIVAASTNGGFYAYDRNGNIVPPWLNLRYSSLQNGASESSPVVADINGDGLPDAVIGDETGTLTAMSGTGTVLPGFPIVLAGEVRGAAGLCDCDGDGLSEVVVAGWDRNLYVWDYDFPFSPAKRPPWPQFQHDAARTGFYSSPVFVGVEGPEPPLEAPAVVEFSRPWPNPARNVAVVSYAVPASAAGMPFELAVFDLSGRRIQRIDGGAARAGRQSAGWNLRDGNGVPVENGVYFLRLTLGSTIQARRVAVVR